jgi:leucyl aminopeptidase
VDFALTLYPAPDPRAVPLHVVSPESLAGWLERQDEPTRAWVRAADFAAGLGDLLLLPAPDGGLRGALLGWGTPETRARDRFHLARVRDRLPPGRYALAAGDVVLDPEIETLGWLLAGYRFRRYRQGGKDRAVELVCPDGVDVARVTAIAEAAAFAQELIDTPARDMGPEALEAAFTALGAAHGAAVSVTRGARALRAANLPMIEAVGAAASEAPRLLDLVWGRDDAPKVTLVGKGVCFDTGGLDIKPPSSMGLMKKDMGGAATAMGLARIVMSLGLDIRLRLLVPAVENAISGAAMRPGDILPSRKGLTVEINNTDAEGRLVLGDALALADEERPELIVSLATLTGAARVALGPDVPPFFTDDDALAADLAGAAAETADPLWRLPFWAPYEGLIEPGIADLDNAPSGGMAGSITAALFLRRFVTASPRYIHLDIYGWTPQAKPGRPKGGAFQAARALHLLLERRFCPVP